MLTSEVDAETPTAVVHLAGELSVSTAPGVRATLHKVLTAQPTAIVVDLDATVVAEDTSLLVFSAFSRAAADWPGCPVLLSVPHPGTREALHRLAVSRSAPVFDDLAAARRAAAAVPAPHRYREPLLPVHGACAVARRVVRDACLAWQVAGRVDDAEIVVSELVANAVRHAAPPLELLVTVRERYLHISVRDGSPVRPRRVLPDPDTAEGGRGLLLVDAVAAGWGTTEVAGGKVVWATLKIRR